VHEAVEAADIAAVEIAVVDGRDIAPPAKIRESGPPV
jgi:hypothetical protein